MTAMMCDSEAPLEAERQRLRAERLELEAARLELEADRLSLRAERMKAARQSDEQPPSSTDASTQQPSPAPDLPVGATASPQLAIIEELQSDVLALCTGRVEQLDKLEQAVAYAWVVAQQAQLDEIEALKPRVGVEDEAKRLLTEGAEEFNRKAEEGQLDWGSIGRAWKDAKTTLEAEVQKQEGELTPNDLWLLSEELAEEAPREDRRLRARELGGGIFRFLTGLARGSSLVNPEEQQERKAARLALLEGNVAAGSVDYLLFGEALSQVELFDSVADARQTAEEAAETLPIFIGNWLARTLDGDEVRQVMEQMDEEQPVLEEDREAVEALKKGIQGQGKMPFWVDQLGIMIRRSEGFTFEFTEGGESEVNFVPLGVMLLCARLGDFAPTAAYILARRLARINVRRLASAQGIDMPSQPDKQVSLQEASLVGSLFADVLGYTALGFLITLLVSGFVLWQLGAALLAGLSPPPPDPLAF